MTNADELSRTQRRWLTLLTAALLALTCAALVAERSPGGVYWSRVAVKFLIPTSPDNPNVIKTTTASLVRTAGAVARIVDPSGGKIKLADDDVTLASEGIEHGTAVTLPNAGGQWSYNFSQAELQVEAVGTSPDEVTSRMTTVINRLHAALASLQPANEVAAENMIKILQTPGGPPPIYSEPANRTRALAVTALLGVLLTVLARIAFRAAVRRRRPTLTARPHPDRQLERGRVVRAASGPE